MKRILGVIGVIGVLGATALLIYVLAANFGNIIPDFFKPVPANIPKLEFTKDESPEIAEHDKWSPAEHDKWTEGEQGDSSFPPASLPLDCNPFEGMELSLVFLNIRKDTMALPFYLKTVDALFPGLAEVDGGQNWHATLGDIKTGPCGEQGFDDRLYCTAIIEPDMPGTVVNVKFFKEDCEDAVLEITKMSIPELPVVEKPSPTCSKNLGKEACQAAGGKMSEGRTTAPYCVCP